MRINFITNTLAATPIRPLFKGDSKAPECSECNNCPNCQKDAEIKPETQNVDNKGLSGDKFEKTTVEE